VVEGVVRIVCVAKFEVEQADITNATPKIVSMFFIVI